MVASLPAYAGAVALPEPDPGMLALLGSAVTGVAVFAQRKFREYRNRKD